MVSLGPKGKTDQLFPWDYKAVDKKCTEPTLSTSSQPRKVSLKHSWHRVSWSCDWSLSDSNHSSNSWLAAECVLVLSWFFCMCSLIQHQFIQNELYTHRTPNFPAFPQIHELRKRFFISQQKTCADSRRLVIIVLRVHHHVYWSTSTLFFKCFNPPYFVICWSAAILLFFFKQVNKLTHDQYTAL